MANIVLDFLHNYQTGERRETEPANAYQYDEGHVLEAVLPAVVTAVELHYWIRGMEEAEAYEPGSITPNSDGSCTVLGNIPNKYFETNGELRIYIVVTDGTASITNYEGKLHICQRSMPDDYVDDDPENEATRILTEARAAAATATAAAQTAQDVADSIPADYTQLSDDVSQLKEDSTLLDDRVTTLEQGGSGSGLTEDIKAALLQMARKVAYIDEDGQDYYDDLYDALYTVTAISVNPTTVTLQTIGGTQQLTATTTPSGAGVSWASSNTAVATVDANGLVTSVGYGSATITATAGQLSATCAVVVAQATLTSISAVYTQSGTVYDTDSLDSLKDDLVVTAHWSNGTTSTVASADYTLSGTLTVGTSTVTVTYGGKTTTFTVTVTAGLYPMTITASDSGVGFGSVDSSKNTMTPPYVANTNRTRAYAFGENALGYEINPSKQYRISVTATEDTVLQMVIHEFNETAYTALQNVEAVPTGNKVASSWLNITPSTPYTYTPTQVINGEPPVCIWLTFKQTDGGGWATLDGLFPITIEQL